jgi:glyceraldehyde 3-phosphate dehydrogenase
VIPELEGRMDGMAFRVPIEDGSVCDMVATLATEVSVDDLLAALRKPPTARCTAC